MAFWQLLHLRNKFSEEVGRLRQELADVKHDNEAVGQGNKVVGGSGKRKAVGESDKAT